MEAIKEFEIEVDDAHDLVRQLEMRGIRAQLVKYEDAYSDPFLSTIASLLDEHMANCAFEFARARGGELRLIKAKDGLYLLLIPI